MTGKEVVIAGISSFCSCLHVDMASDMSAREMSSLLVLTELETVKIAQWTGNFPWLQKLVVFYFLQWLAGGRSKLAGRVPLGPGCSGDSA